MCVPIFLFNAHHLLYLYLLYEFLLFLLILQEMFELNHGNFKDFLELFIIILDRLSHRRHGHAILTWKNLHFFRSMYQTKKREAHHTRKHITRKC